MFRTATAIGFVSFALVSTICAQKVHVGDIDWFVGRLPVIETDSGRVIECCEFTDWFVDIPDLHLPKSVHRPKLRSVKFSRGHHLLADWKPITEQDGEFIWSGRWSNETKDTRKFWRYRWYILIDSFGHERQRNVLTVWKLTTGDRLGGSDSLTFVCGQIGSFDSGIGRADVKRVTSFPDGSLLAVVHNYGEGYGRYDFFRGIAPCELELFYSKASVHFTDADWKHGNSEKVYYNFKRLMYPSFQLSELIEYGHYDDTKLSIDSTTVKILDLWKMAIEYFKIDTTSSN